MKFVDDFKTWALKECSEFKNKRETTYIEDGLGSMTCRYHWNFYKNKTIILDMETGKVGIAWCKDGDKFSANIGVGVAWAKLKGEEIPMERTETAIKNLKCGDKFIFFGTTKVYTFIYYYNVDLVKRCFFATGEDLEESFTVNPDMRVIKL